MLDLIKEVPESPGCYLYYNIDDEVIYVGKAKNLKKRMASYFNRSNNTKTQHLVGKITRFDYFITNTETEALILENNLIKKYTPFYNIILKDDKKYPYIVITEEKHPRIIRTRNRNQKGIYFGPYPSGGFVKHVINYLNKRTKLRKCTKLPKEECLYYYIDQCYAPCINVGQGEDIVASDVLQIKKLLSNNMKELSKEISAEMEKRVEALDFEEAAEYRDILVQIEDYKEKQSVQLKEVVNLHILDYYHDDSFISISLLIIEEGKLLNIHRVLVPYYDDVQEEITSYLNEYYLTNEKPEYFATEDKTLASAVEKLLYVENRNMRSQEYQHLITIAKDNAREYYQKNIDKITKEYFIEKNKGFKELQKLTKNKLERVEMFDISHLGGDAQVGAMVVYNNGTKDPSEYRKYKIKKEENLKDDYGSIREVLERRVKRGLEEGNLPDMIIIDGGKGQVSSALKILKNYGVDDILLIGLSKDDKHKTKGIVNKNLDEVILRRNSDLYKFLYNMQEEVHRFAIGFHRQLKTKSTFQSELDKIPGIGPKRKLQLMERFGYVENLRNASPQELRKIGIPEKVIGNIRRYFDEKDEKN